MVVRYFWGDLEFYTHSSPVQIHSRSLVILGRAGVPSDKRGGTPGVGSAYLRIRALLQGFLVMKIKYDGTFDGISI